MRAIWINGPARADLDAFVARWLDSQNQGNFATCQTFCASSTSTATASSTP